MEHWISIISLVEQENILPMVRQSILPGHGHLQVLKLSIMMRMERKLF